MSKKKPCGLDYCPLEEIIGAYASCTACAWSNDGNDETREDIKRADGKEQRNDGENTCHNNCNSLNNNIHSLE